MVLLSFLVFCFMVAWLESIISLLGRKKKKKKKESSPIFYMQSDPLHPSVKKVPKAAEVRNSS